jgi:hypothetical protein
MEGSLSPRTGFSPISIPNAGHLTLSRFDHLEDVGLAWVVLRMANGIVEPIIGPIERNIRHGSSVSVSYQQPS